jgi:hypothetical protein
MTQFNIAKVIVKLPKKNKIYIQKVKINENLVTEKLYFISSLMTKKEIIYLLQDYDPIRYKHINTLYNKYLF